MVRFLRFYCNNRQNKNSLSTNEFDFKHIRLVEKMEEVEGFEPPRDLTPLSVFKTDPFSRAWVYLRINN